MSEKVNKIDKIKKETGLTYRPIKVKDAPVIVRYFEDTGLKDRVFEILFPKEEMKISTWAELREELELSAEELDLIKKRSRGDFVTALRITPGAEHLVPEVKTREDILREIIQLIFDVFGEKNIYEKTVELLAYLYSTEVEVIEELTFKQLEMVAGAVIEDENFMTS